MGNCPRPRPVGPRPARRTALTRCPSLQIPVTQACLMEDIEQWLSTDVVSPAPSSPT